MRNLSMSLSPTPSSRTQTSALTTSLSYQGVLTQSSWDMTRTSPWLKNVSSSEEWESIYNVIVMLYPGMVLRELKSTMEEVYGFKATWELSSYITNFRRLILYRVDQYKKKFKEWCDQSRLPPKKPRKKIMKAIASREEQKFDSNCNYEKGLIPYSTQVDVAPCSKLVEYFNRDCGTDEVSRCKSKSHSWLRSWSSQRPLRSKGCFAQHSQATRIYSLAWRSLGRIFLRQIRACGLCCCRRCC